MSSSSSKKSVASVADAAAAGRIDWLVSYPKSGNTWMRLLLANYFSEADVPHDINAPGVTRGTAGSRWLFDTFLGLPSSDLTGAEIAWLRPHAYRIAAERNTARFWVKVHDRQAQVGEDLWLFPPNASGVAVYIVRDPRDVAVSNAFHDGHRDMERAVAKLGDSAMTIAGARAEQLPQHLGDWSSHVTSWADQRDIPVLVLRYEDMLTNAAAVLRRVIAFARPELAIDDARLAHAAHATRIEALQAVEAAGGFREARPRAGRFFRRGQGGDWRNHLSDDQAARIVRRHLAVMQRFGYA